MKRPPYSLGYRLVSVILVPALMASPMPAIALPLPAPETTVTVNRTVPSAEPIAPSSFSSSPSDAEFARIHIFDEPLVPFGATSAEENRALAHALTVYRAGADPEALGPIDAFLASHPRSAWRAALLTNMGTVYRRTGYFSRALTAWEQAWALGKEAMEARPKAIADRALAELAELNARLGRYDRLEALFAEIEGRAIGGASTEKIAGARRGLWVMRNETERGFLCGPMAVDRILSYGRSGYTRPAAILNARSTLEGTSLVQVRELARGVGLSLQAARRAGDAEILLPAVVHWKAGHFAALVAERNGRYLVQDPTFGDETWLSRRAIDDESSGYMLVRAGALPAGWSAIGEADAGRIWGKGITGGSDPSDYGPNNHNNCGDCGPGGGGGGGGKGMATYKVNSMLVNLHITDTPVGYAPPRGPAVNATVYYNHREVFQPAIPSFSNFGPKWTHTWLTYVEDDPGALGGTVTVYSRGGGRETFSGYDPGTQSHAPHSHSHAVLVRTADSPIRYERRLPNGGVEVFAKSDGGVAPRRVFLIEEIDPQGNKLTFTYDPTAPKLLAVTDPIGQVTTFEYAHPTDPLKITRVTDPFARFARFDYDGDGRLQRITDVIGLTSEFQYGPQDFIEALTTPYGTTRFTRGEAGLARWIETVDPLGGRERVEYRSPAMAVPDAEPAVPTGITVANGYLKYRNTFFWDKRAMALYPGDYSKARVYHWLHTSDGNLTDGVLESEKAPLESRIWYSYPGQSMPAFAGTSTSPTKIARLLDDGSTQLFQYEYGPLGHVTRFTDPVGRETIYEYAANGIDLLTTKQKNGGTYDVLEARTYNSQHEPLTITDVAGQITTYTYNANGMLATMVTAPRSGLSAADRTTTYTYFADNAAFGPGRMQTSTGPSSAQGSPTRTFTYDSYGRTRTETDFDNHALTYDYDTLDRLTRTTHPDGTYDETTYSRLDPEKQRDRLGRWTHAFYDALRPVVSMRDSSGRTIAQTWCTCGSRDKVTDANGNSVAWERDVQGRVTREVRADGSDRDFVYEATTNRLKQTVDAKNQTRTYSYTSDNNLIGITYTNAQYGTSNVTHTYDAEYDRLTATSDGAGTTSFTYQSIGSLGANRLASIDGPLSGDTISYGYDELSRPVSRQVNGTASTLSVAYDSLGRITTETDVLGTFTYTYDGPTGRPASMVYPGGRTTTYTYSPNSGDHQLQDLHNKLPGGATLSRFQYTYDAVDNVTTWSQQRDASPTQVLAFEYDASNHLVAAQRSPVDAALVDRFAYTYDKARNRTAEQLDDAVVSATYNNMNRLTSTQPGGALRFHGTVNEAAAVTVGGGSATVSSANEFDARVSVGSGTSTVAVVATDPSGNARTNSYQVSQTGSTASFTYDMNGNLIGDGTRTYEWDAEDRLVAISQGTHRSEFVYDGRDRRIRAIEKESGVTQTDRRYVWCEARICEERDAAGTVVLKRFLSHGVQEGSTRLYARDHLGSVRELTDASGTVLARYDYDPFGRRVKLSGSSDTDVGFTGHWTHAPSGLVLAWHRAYDASMGRWLSQDPIGLRGGPNLYTYVNNMPANRIDPLGLAAADAKTAPSNPDAAYYICCYKEQIGVCKGPHTFQDLKVRKCALDHEQIHLDDIRPCRPPGHCKGVRDRTPVTGPEPEVRKSECKAWTDTWKCLGRGGSSGPEFTGMAFASTLKVLEYCGHTPVREEE